jgi:elongation factor Ts
MTKIQKIKELRSKTGVSIALVSKALSEAGNDIKKAEELLKVWGVELADKKKEKATEQGVITSYIHHNGKIGAMVSLLCQTDFVAKNEDFKKLAYEIAMQIASMNPKTSDELLNQAYIRDPKITVANLIKASITKLGENINIGDFVRLEL